MRKTFVIFSSLFAGCGFISLPLTACSNSIPNSAPMNKVHEFINERTFTLTAAITNDNKISATTGTSWIFYHDKQVDPTNNYIYYAITNFHVIEGILNWTKAEGRNIPVEIGVGFSNDTDAKANKTIDLFDLNKTWVKNPNQANSLKVLDLETVAVGTNIPNTILYDQYFNYQNISPTNTALLMDMAIVKYDFSSFIDSNDPTSNDIGKRLTNLNKYADSNNNYVTPIATKVDYDSWSNSSFIASNIYASGYPVVNIKGDKIHRNLQFGTSLKSQNFDYDNLSLFHYPINTSYENLIKNVFYNKNTNPNHVVQTIDSDDIPAYTYSNDYQFQTSNSNIEFGGGASGSMGMFATNIDDPNTYKACGIYWGYLYNPAISKYYLSLSPFLLNWGQSIITPSGQEYKANETFIESFFNNKSNCPMDNIIRLS